jgi:H+/Cl- antiporter ClcA
MSRNGDFTAGVRLFWISALAVVIGVICAGVAVVLLNLIQFFTNLFYFQQFSLVENSPAKNTLGLASILVPMIGGLIIGLMARYGSEKIRGHGIPEALEAILIGRSRMSPKVAVLKPLSSAISIGSGGPFGAEGPIIMTGGAFGSIISQVFHLTAAERKTLLVAGAAGGMAATFATPVAAVLLAVELLLFEFKPRSLVPVALASSTAALVRPFLLGPGPLFAVVPHAPLGLHVLLSAALLGVFAGALALVLTLAVYAFEDLFQSFKFHWMWWPVLGGLVIGIGGYFQPRALGVGYDLIKDLLHGHYELALLLPLVLVKCWIWSTALGSGTSGGVLAPLLIMGGALGAFAAAILPGDATLWPLIGMGAILGGTMRSPLTGALFALELTGDLNALPALLLASVTAYGFTVLVMKRSILTEKLARRGQHVSREYSVDPLELTSVESVMSATVVTVPATLPVEKLLQDYYLASGPRKHQGYPVVDDAGRLLGVVTRSDLMECKEPGAVVSSLMKRSPVTAMPWESCRAVAERMAESGVGRLIVVDPDDCERIAGIVTRSDLLKPRRQNVEEEKRRERFIRMGGGRNGRKSGERPVARKG